MELFDKETVQIKIFSSLHLTGLQTEVNDWLGHIDYRFIKDIKLSESDDYYTVMVVYTKGGE